MHKFKQQLHAALLAFLGRTLTMVWKIAMPWGVCQEFVIKFVLLARSSILDAQVLWHIRVTLNLGRAASACVHQTVDDVSADVPSQTKKPAQRGPFPQ